MAPKKPLPQARAIPPVGELAPLQAELDDDDVPLAELDDDDSPSVAEIDEDTEAVKPRRPRPKGRVGPNKLLIGGIVAGAVGFVAVVGLLAWFLWNNAQNIYTDNPAGWQPETSLLRRLGNEVELPPFQQYRLRPPKGYVMLSQTFGAGRFITVGASPRTDQTRSAVFVEISPPLPPGANMAAMDKIFEALLEGFEHAAGREAWTWEHGEFEHGTMCSIPFLRARLSGLDDKKKKQKGFAYLGTDGPTAIFFFSFDSESYPDDLRLVEASVLTFRKR
jgi:hypothetical protein